MFTNIHPLILVSMFFSVLVGIALLIIGMLITTSKTKSTKILGIGFIVDAILSFLANVLNLIRYTTGNPDLITALAQAINVLSITSMLAGALIICLFIHKNYGCKWIYFPIFAQPVVNGIANVAFRYVFSRMGDSRQYITGTGLSTAMSSLVVGSVEALILIIVFYKNRKNEKIIPHAWIIRLISFCCYLILPISSIIFYGTCFSAGLRGEDIYFELSERFYIFQYGMNFFNSLVGMVMPVYILVMAKRAERTLEETAPYIED